MPDAFTLIHPEGRARRRVDRDGQAESIRKRLEVDAPIVGKGVAIANRYADVAAAQSLVAKLPAEHLADRLGGETHTARVGSGLHLGAALGVDQRERVGHRRLLRARG